MQRRDFIKRGLTALTMASMPSFVSKAGIVEYPEDYHYETPKVTSEDLPNPNSKVKQVYLTIDDGPGHYMQGILDKLDKSKGKVTFFIVGQHYNGNSRGHALLVEAIQKGHLIGNHSFSHPNFHNLSQETAKSEIQRTDEIIEKVYADSGIERNPNTKLFRFPYGATKSSITPFLKEIDYKPIKSWDENKGNDWDIDSLDWRYGNGLSGESIMKICRRTNAGDVILIHDTPAPKTFTFNSIIPYFSNTEEYKLIIPT